MNTLTKQDQLDKLNIFQDCIEALNEANALEIHPAAVSEKQLDFYVPYMMNDALEYYFMLENCHLTGAASESIPTSDDTSRLEAEVVLEENRKALVVRVYSHFSDSDDFKLFTIWFQNIQIFQNCYQYHQIGHFWVKGQEQWRRLVYLIGTIYDKQEYIGNEVCNELEQALLPLMEFSPFRMWFPLHAIPENFYENTQHGNQCMQSLAMEAGDICYAHAIALYRHLPFSWMRSLFSPILGRAMTSPRRQPLYQLILEKVYAASETYPERDYGTELNTAIQNRRKEITSLLYAKGFTGRYPLFHRESMQILAAEEHPFTVMESENFSFQIRFMVSETLPPFRKKNHHGINYGFFRSKHTKGWIAENLDFL